MKKRIAISTRTLLGFAVFVGFCLLSLTQLKVFAAHSQVTFLWDSGQPLVHHIGDFHFSRYLVSYPGLFLEESYPGIGYSIYISIFVTLNTLLFRRVHNGMTGYPPNVLAYIFFLLIFLFMNGRGVIGWSGWLLCLSLHCKLRNYGRTVSFLTFGNVSLFFCSILFSTVSSGIFIVVFMSTVFLAARLLRASNMGLKFKSTHFFKNFFSIIMLGYITYLAIFYLLDALHKILLFYGSYNRVIMHGLGSLALSYDLSIVLFTSLIITVSLILLWIILKRNTEPVIWPLLIISMVGGAFGFTTMTLSIPLVLIFFSVLLRMTRSAYRIPAH